MAKLSYKISYYVLYALFAIAIAIIIAFFTGGDAQGDAIIASIDPAIWQPAQTDLMLYWMYALGALTILATLVGILVKFGSSFKDNPVKALKSLTSLIILIVIVAIAWSMGSEEILTIPGYEGTQNTPFWLKLTDMFIFTFYILFVATIAAMLFGVIKKKLS